MRITIVQGAFFPVPPLLGGAVEKMWFSLGQEFVRQGHTVTHLSRRYRGLPDQESIAGVSHRRVPGYDTPAWLPWLKMLDLAYSLRVLRDLPAADILITNTFWLPILVRSSRWGRLYVHVGRFPKGQMRFYAHAARVQTVSRAVARAIAAEIPAHAAKVRTIGYPALHCSPPAALERSRDRILLYVGRVHPEKGVHLLVEAVNALPEALFAGWKLVVVGPLEVSAGGGGEAYRKVLDPLLAARPGRVELTGPIFDEKQLADQYRRAALFVYPSLADRGETFGLAPLEAMAHGCPPLVSGLECFRDFITPGENGFVFDHSVAQPAEALAAALTHLLGDPRRLAQVGRRSRDTAAELSLESVAEVYLQDFASLLNIP